MKSVSRRPAGPLCAAALVLQGIGTTAEAEGRWSGQIAATSDYVLRGVSQTDGHIAVQGSLAYRASSGVYAGAKTSDAAAETRLALTALREVVKKAGGDFEHLVKATYYPATDATSAALNQVRPEFYNPARPPAASKAPVTHTGDAESEITLDLIAVTAK